MPGYEKDMRDNLPASGGNTPERMSPAQGAQPSVQTQGIQDVPGDPASSSARAGVPASSSARDTCMRCGDLACNGFPCQNSILSALNVPASPTGVCMERQQGRQNVMYISVRHGEMRAEDWERRKFRQNNH